MDDRLAFLTELTEAAGPSGYEDPVRQVMARRLASHCNLSCDRLGSLIAQGKDGGDGPRIMLSGHMDEPAFVVKRITDRGYLKFEQLTGWWPQRLIGQIVTVLTKKGPIPGVIDCKNEMRMRAEELRQNLTRDDLFVDIGAQDAEQVGAWGIRQGTPFVPSTRFTVMASGEHYLAKAWDDRVGCGLATDTLLALTQMPHHNTVFVAGTVQEELGCRGAQTAGTAIKPDVGIALEVGVATDTPCLGADEIIPVVLGKGPTLDVYEHNFMPSPGLVDLAYEVAEAEGISLQPNVVSSGGTDAHKLNLLDTGVPCLVIGVPTRYVHAMAGVIHRRDYDQAVQFLAALVARLDSATVNSVLPH